MTNFEFIKKLDKEDFIKFLRLKFICPPCFEKRMKSDDCLYSSIPECLNCWLSFLDDECDEVKD